MNSIPSNGYRFVMSDLAEINTAIRIKANLGQFGGGGILVCNGREYRVDHVTQSVTRQFSGVITRALCATWDFFVRGSFRSRAKAIEDIIFGRETATLSLKIKSSKTSVLSDFAARLASSGIDMSRVQYRKKTNFKGLKRAELLEPKIPEIDTSEGVAKQLSRKIIVRSWLDKVEEFGPTLASALLSPSFQGHSAIEVKDSINKKSNYASVFEHEKHGHFVVEDNYKADKQFMLGHTTNTKLGSGDFEPRAFQFRVKNPDLEEGQFGVSASSKIYLPCFGVSFTKHNAPIKVLFGLSETATDNAIVGLLSKGMRLKYRYASKDRNCCGTVLKMLLAGGAGRFVQRPKAEFFYTPLEVERYTRELQQYLDWINTYTDKLIAIVGTEKITNIDHFSRESIEPFRLWTQAPTSIKDCMFNVQKNMHTMSNEELISQAKILVTLLADELGDAPEIAIREISTDDAARAKKNGLLSVISMIHLIREKVCEVRCSLADIQDLSDVVD